MATKCTVYGNLENLTSGALPAGTVTLELSNIGTGNAVTVTGTAVIPQLKYVIYTAADGSFTSTVWGNDNINPSNTIYNVTFRDASGNEIGPIQYSFTGPTVNLNTASPINNVLPPIFAASVSVLTLLNHQPELSIVNGTGADATLYTYSISANAIGPGQGIRVTACWGHTTSSASATYKMKLGATTLFSTAKEDINSSSIVLEVFNYPFVQNEQNWTANSILGGSPDVTTAFGGVSFENLANMSSITLTANFNVADQIVPIFWLVEIINGPPNSIPTRLQVAGSALGSGDFTLSGWGSGASITGIRGCDSANEFLITAGTGPSVGPTVTLTFHDGAWPNEPVTIAEIVGGTGQMSTNEITGSTTAFTLTYLGFPVAGATYLYRTVTVGI